MIKKLTMWMTTDGQLHEEKDYAKARQKRLDDVRAINERIKAGEMLGPLFGGFFHDQYTILDSVNTDTPIVLSHLSQYQYHVEELLADGRVVLRLKHYNEESVTMTKTELCFRMRHPANQHEKRTTGSGLHP